MVPACSPARDHGDTNNAITNHTAFFISHLKSAHRHLLLRQATATTLDVTPARNQPAMSYMSRAATLDHSSNHRMLWTNIDEGRKCAPSKLGSPNGWIQR